MEKLKLSLLFVTFAIVLSLVGCTPSVATNDSSSTAVVDGNGYVTLSMTVGNEAFRSALPDTPSAVYFQIAAFNVASGNVSGITTYATAKDAYAASGNASDKSFKTIANDATSKTATFKLKAGEAWAFVAVGGSLAYSDKFFQSSSAASKDAVYTADGEEGGTAGTTYIKGYRLVYVAADGTVKDGGTSTGTDITGNITISTTADTTGTGTVKLPVQVPHVASLALPDKYITSVKMILTNKDSAGTSYEKTVTLGAWATGADETAVTVADFTTFNAVSPATGTDISAIAAGNYDVTISCLSDANEIYTYRETLTVWSDQPSHWVNSAGTYTTEANYTKLNSDNYLTLCFNGTYIKNYKRHLFYVAGGGTGSVLTGGDDTNGDGSIFKPFASLKRAVTACADTGAAWTILVDGTTAESAGFLTTPQTSGGSITINKLSSAATIGNGSNAFSVNDGVIFKNITVKGNVIVNTKNFIFVNSTVDSGYAMTINDNCYVTVDVANIASGTGTIANIKPETVIALNSVMLKHYDPDQDGAIDSSDETAAMLTEAIVERFPLESTYAAGHGTYTIGVDTDTADNPTDKSGSYGDGILKVKQTVTLNVGGISLVITPTVTTGGTAGTTMAASAVDGVKNVTLALAAKQGTETVEPTYAGTLTLKEGESSSSAATISTGTTAVVIPSNVKNVTETTTFTLYASFTVTYNNATQSCNMSIPITITK